MATSLAHGGSITFLQGPSLDSSSSSSSSSSFPHLPSCSLNTGLHVGHGHPASHARMSSSLARSGSGFRVSATVAAPELVQEEVNYDELSLELAGASPLEIMDRALLMFKSDIAIAFSGAEDVALIEYAKLTGRPFRVFSLDTGRLNPETYKFFDQVEKRYGIRIEYMFPDAAEVEALVRTKGMFSFYEDGHQECCRIRKVKPLRRALKGLKAWITGQRRDQSPGTRSNVPIVQIDSSFEGLDGGPGSLIKWNPVANVKGTDIWSFLRTMNVPVNSLHSQGYISIGCEPCTRAVLPGMHEREGRWWWEDAKAKECGLHKGNIERADGSSDNRADKSDAVTDLFLSKNIKTFSRTEMEEFAKSEHRKNSWIVVLYAPWCPYCQAMEPSFNALAEELSGSKVLVGKFNADKENKAYAMSDLQMKSFPTILFFSKNLLTPIKYPSEQRDVDSLLAFIKALQ
ncbi:hypothetical protein L7F22_040969 [Adiantum nelumboides]|nr:hypothetical protein [Adiantum nelumboides]